MALSWFSSRGTSLNELLARKKYDKAAEVLREQLAKHKGDARLRLQLADVLVKGGEKTEAVALLMDLADELVLSNAPAKAISVLKRLKAIQPEQSFIDERLARLIKGRAVAANPPPAAVQVEMEADQFPALHLEELDLGIDMAGADALPRLPAVLSEPDGVGFFAGFSEAELVAVMRGLELRGHGAGDIIVSEGEPGSSLFVLTRGAVRAWVRDATGKNRPVRDLAEGEFFGEIALLNSSPRTATVTALRECELLELDRKALTSILETHPKVVDVLRKFHAERHGSSVEAAVRSAGAAGAGAG